LTQREPKDRNILSSEGDSDLNRKENNGKKNPKGPAPEIKTEVKEGKTSAPEKQNGEEKKELSPLEKLKAEFEEKTRECSESFDKWIRLLAEFENYKKRMQKDKADLIKFGNESLLKGLLPVLDNLERAIEHARAVKESSSLLEGVELVQKQFLTALESFGVKPVPAEGEIFDPEKHEAVSMAENEMEPNRVVSKVVNGYFYHDRLLRPAKVIVSKGKTGPA
jgi:molecular chaperone GrpE